MMVSTSQMLGKEILCGSVTTVARALSATLKGLVHFICHEDVFKHMADDMAELNLESDVELIEVIVDELQVHMQARSRRARSPQRRSVSLALRHLHGALDEIHQALQNFRSHMEAHQQLWFSYYRAFDSAGHLRLLRLCKRRLDHHFDRLVKVHQIFVPPAPGSSMMLKTD